MEQLMEYKGKDIDEAIKNACAALNVSQEELDIEIVSTGSSGIFGLGRRQAVVRVSLRREQGARPEPEPPAPGADASVHQAVPVSEEDRRQLRALVANILERMGVSLEVAVEEDDGKVRMILSGDALEKMVANDGRTLDALQYLVRKIATKQLGRRLNLEIDGGGYREARRQELVRQAREFAREVRETGRSRTMPAINPAERRIVHLALQEEQDVRSRSVGEGPFKKILIYPPGKGRKKGRRRGGGKPAGNR